MFAAAGFPCGGSAFVFLSAARALKALDNKRAAFTLSEKAAGLRQIGCALAKVSFCHAQKIIKRVHANLAQRRCG